MTDNDASSKAKETVVEISKTVISSTPRDGDNRRPQKKRRRLLLASFILMVLAPIILGSYYYAFLASDRYVSEAGFAVRGVNSGGGIDSIGALTGLASSGSTTSDSYIILRYLHSRDIVERLQVDINLQAVFSFDEIDGISRMKPDLSIEEFVKYWDRMIDTSFDSNSGVVFFRVQAFRAEDAKSIADLLLGYTQTLVNRLSEDARKDSAKFAEAEVTRAEERLRVALYRIREFRDNESSIDPAASAQLDIELVSGLESRLIDIRARMAAISGSINENAPSMIALRRQAEALEIQISERVESIGGTTRGGKGGAALSTLLAAFEALEVEKNFAEQAYASSLSSLENARIEADRQQRYLAVFSTPALPEEAILPRRLINIVMLIVTCFCVWGISTLLVYSVRDHLS